ncbi:MAG: hypothetical protein U1F11_11950 [Steroidobacteraceae bacterium]
MDPKYAPVAQIAAPQNLLLRKYYMLPTANASSSTAPSRSPRSPR